MAYTSNALPANKQRTARTSESRVALPAARGKLHFPCSLRPLCAWLAAASLMVLALPAQADFTASGSNSAWPQVVPTGPGNADLGNVRLGIGIGSFGSFRVDGGSQLTVGNLSIGSSGNAPAGSTVFPLGDGNVVIDGLGSLLTLASDGYDVVNRLDLGLWGKGSLTVSGGATLDGRANGASCELQDHHCSAFIGNGAGSDATLTVTGAGSSASFLRHFGVGNVAVFRPPIDGFYLGTPGEATQGRVHVLAGGTLITDNASIGMRTNNPSALGNERSFAEVVIDGPGSVWRVTGASIADWNPNAGYGASFSTAEGPNAWATIAVSNGGKLRIEDKPGYYASVNLTSGGGRTDMRVDGAGSTMEFMGPDASLQIGRRGAGGSATLSVTNGGSVKGMQYLSVGRDGAIGTLNIDGIGSHVTVNGVSSAGVANPTHGQATGPAGTAYVSIGRGGGYGVVNVTNGGTLNVLANQALTNSTAFDIARDANSAGVLNISGDGSQVLLQMNPAVHGSGSAEGNNPLMRVGRDGSGTLNISAGGKLLIDGQAVSTPTNTRGTNLYIGGSSSTTLGGKGVATVTGAGSEIRLTGSDTYIGIGHGPQSSGHLNVSNQGLVSATGMIVGRNGGVGVLQVDNATLSFSGQHTGSAQSGAFLTIGHSDGIGVAQISNQSRVTLTNPGSAGAGLVLGGTRNGPRGDGSLTLSGGSSITINAASGMGQVVVGRDGSALLRMRGASSLDVGDGSLYVGRLAGGDGTLIATEGSTIRAGWVGVGRNQTADGSVDGGTGTMVLNGASLVADTIVIGTNGFLGGSAGSITANLVQNFGTFSPGNSPGTMTIDADYIAEAGSRLILEVQALAEGGFATDQLIFMPGRTIDLGGLDIEFRFLGATDPNAFLASGQFDIDTFMGYATTSPGSTTPLADGTFAGVSFSASAQQYNFTQFSYSLADGAVFTAAPVPEPESWAMLLAGVGIIGAVARRRRLGSI